MPQFGRRANRRPTTQYADDPISALAASDESAAAARTRISRLSHHAASEQRAPRLCAHSTGQVQPWLTAAEQLRDVEYEGRLVVRMGRPSARTAERSDYPSDGVRRSR